MNQIDTKKYSDIIKKKKKQEENQNSKKKSYVTNLIIRCFISFLVIFFFAIIYRSESNLKEKISIYLFQENISFTKINKIYDKYLGGLLPVKKNNNVTQVFNEKLNYNASSIYYDGVKLSVLENYLVPAIDEGMVVFIGEKENYGSTIIIENLDGVDFWYSNISNTNLKLYDYVEKGNLVGEVSNELYMVFSKDGKYLNYEEYIY